MAHSTKQSRLRSLILVAVFTFISVLLPLIAPFLPQASAAPQPPPTCTTNCAITGVSITAQFIDAAHIAVTATGTYSWDPVTGKQTTNGANAGGDSVDFSQLTGIYFAGNDLRPDINTLRTGTGSTGNAPGGQYWFGKNQQSFGTCPQGSNHNSDFSPTYRSDFSFNGTGRQTDGQLDVWLPLTAGSSSGGGNCVAPDFGATDVHSLSVNITDPATGVAGNFADSGIPAAVSANQYASGSVYPAGLVYFFLHDPKTIYGVSEDIDFNGFKADEMTFTLNGNVYQTTKRYNCVNGSPNGRGGGTQLPDEIDMPADTSPLYVFAPLKICNVVSNHVVVLTQAPTTQAPVNSAPGGTGGTVGPSPDTVQCTSDIGASVSTSLNWILCPLIDHLWDALDRIDGWITDQLVVDVSGVFDTSSCTSSQPNQPCTAQAYYAAWNSFRIIATAIVVIAGLLMVASQAFGFQILDAYTIRKVLPRLVVATIGMSLSWPLMRLFVSFFDTAGVDILNIMYAPFAKLGGGITPATTTFTALFGAGALFALGFTSLTFLLSGLLILLTTFLVLMARQIILIVLIIMAPIAIACYILPGTHKVWKIWFDTFFGLMAAFPVYEAVVAAGHIAAKLTLIGN